MAFAYTYDPEENLLAVKFWGEISHEEELEAVRRALGDPRLKSDFKAIADRRLASFASSTDQLRAHLELVAECVAPLGRPRVANVVSTDLDYGMVRMFELLAEFKIDHFFSGFRSIDEACAWIGVDPARIQWPDQPPTPEG
jgi:hypothetical protein